MSRYSVAHDSHHARCSDFGCAWPWWLAIQSVRACFCCPPRWLPSDSTASSRGASRRAVRLRSPLCLRDFSRAYPQAGGPYAYVHVAFGPLIAFIVAWGYWISIWVGNVSIATAAVSYLSPLLPWIAEKPGASALVTLLLLWLLTFVNWYGIKASGWVQGVTTVLKILPLLAVGGTGSRVPAFEQRGGDNAYSALGKRRDRRGDFDALGIARAGVGHHSGRQSGESGTHHSDRDAARHGRHRADLRRCLYNRVVAGSSGARWRNPTRPSWISPRSFGAWAPENSSRYLRPSAHSAR